MKRLVLLLVVFAFSLAMVGSAQAATSVTGLFQPAPTQTLLSDNSAEILINVDGSVSAAGTPTVTVGDILVAMVGINTIEGTTIGSGTTYNEVTAILALKIATASDVDLGPAGADDSFGTQNIDLWQFTATPVTAADTGSFDWSVYGYANDGTLVALVFEDGAQNYTRDGTVAAGQASATDGTLVLDVGLIGANSDFVSVIAPLDLGAFLTVPFATAIDNTNIAMDLTITGQNWVGLNFNNNITAGNGGFSSPTSTSGFPVFDNLDFTVTAEKLPEPASMLLVGSGFIGLAAVARRRFKK